MGIGYNLRGQSKLDSLTTLRENVMATAFGDVGLRERTGHNDNPRIVEYHASVSKWLAKNAPRSPYCASFVHFCLKTNDVKITKVPNPARARDWFRVPSRYILTRQNLRGNRRMIPQPPRASLVGYIFYGGQIGHVELLDKIDFINGYIYCVGANTSGSQAATIVNRDGEGVYYVRRKITQFYLITDIISSQK